MHKSVFTFFVQGSITPTKLEQPVVIAVKPGIMLMKICVNQIETYKQTSFKLEKMSCLREMHLFSLDIVFQSNSKDDMSVRSSRAAQRRERRRGGLFWGLMSQMFGALRRRRIDRRFRSARHRISSNWRWRRRWQIPDWRR